VRHPVVLDTNILLDILVFDDQRAHPLRAALESNRIDAVATQNTFDEFLDVIRRPQFDLDADQQKLIESQWKIWARMIPDQALSIAPWKCKDRDDQVFINLAYSLRPATLISKDKQVLKIAKRAIKESVVITSNHDQFLMEGLNNPNH
jgi:predicted nucleic acid-binding protein